MERLNCNPNRRGQEHNQGQNERRKTMDDQDLLDLARHAISDSRSYHQRAMSAETASASVRELLAYLIDRQPTTEEIEDVLG